MATPRFSFATLNRSNTAAAERQNELIFARGPVFGIDVGKRELEDRCVGGIRLKHNEDGDGIEKGRFRSAIEDAKIIELPPPGTTLAGVREDLDAQGAKAVISLRTQSIGLEPAEERIALVADADKFLRGMRGDQRRLPMDESELPPGVIWQYYNSLAAAYPALEGIIVATADFRSPHSDRVGIMAHWLMTGWAPKE